MQITVEIPDSLAGQLHLGEKADLRSLLQALVEQHVSEGGLTVVQVGDQEKSGVAGLEKPAPSQEPPVERVRPPRDVLARLKGIYGDLPMTGENAVLAARRMERY